jgi:hypothetical protein
VSKEDDTTEWNQTHVFKAVSKAVEDLNIALMFAGDVRAKVILTIEEGEKHPKVSVEYHMFVPQGAKKCSYETRWMGDGKKF